MRNMMISTALHGIYYPVYTRYQSQMNTFRSLIQAGREDQFRTLFDQSDDDLRLLLEVLYYGGRWIYADSHLDLTKLSPRQVQQEFYKFINQFLADQGLSFGIPLGATHLNVRDCQSSAWEKFILHAIGLL